MGLIAFLKNKFGKKNEAEKEEPAPIPAAEEPSEELVSGVEEKEEAPAAIETKEEEEQPVEVPFVAPVEKEAEEKIQKEEKAEIKEEKKAEDAPAPSPIPPVEKKEEKKEKALPTPSVSSSSSDKPEAPKIAKEAKKEAPALSPKEKKKAEKEAKKAEKEAKSLEKYDKGMEKSRKNFASRLDALSKRYAKVNGEYFEELEQILIESDVGVELSLNLIENLLDWSSKEKVSDPAKINEQLIDDMFVDYATKGESFENEIAFQEGITVLLVVGVNGVGKTTSIAKLAHRYMEKGKKVLLVAGDTFRAGATAQLKIWAERLGCPIVVGKENGDPASVAYDGCRYAKEHGIDLMIVDTAGRQQTKANLMQELAKVSRVIGREIPGAPHESFLIIDGTTGQNGVLQAKAFKEVTSLTGIVITKMDGTSKGGIILSIRDELGIPVRFIGLGEGLEDLQEFDLDKYLYGLLLGGEYDG